MDNVKKFIEMLEKDNTLLEQFIQCNDGNEEQMLKRLVAVARDAGYEFNETELDQALETYTVSLEESDELDDAHLEAVAGGRMQPYWDALTEYHFTHCLQSHRRGCNPKEELDFLKWRDSIQRRRNE